MHAVALIDWDNLHIQSNRPFAPDASTPGDLLDMVVGFVRDFALTPHVTVFVNLFGSNVREQLELECDRRRIDICHCPRRGRDYVDDKIVERMLRHDRIARSDVPLALVSADADFAETLKSVRDGQSRRPVYLGLRSDKFDPKHARRFPVATGSAWIDPRTYRHQAMYYLLSGWDFNRNQTGYIHGQKCNSFSVIYPAFTRVRLAVNALARAALHEQPICSTKNDHAELVRWIARVWRMASVDFGEIEAREFLPYLLHYGFVIKSGDNCRVDLDHSQVAFIRRQDRNQRQPAKLQVLHGGRS